MDVDNGVFMESVPEIDDVNGVFDEIDFDNLVKLVGVEPLEADPAFSELCGQVTV